MCRPQISVIMGCVDPRYDKLKKAVDSIRSQTFDSWELLIYDDGSSRAGQKVILEAIRGDKRIRCLRGDINRGLAHALNVCIRNARGKYIARMDDDDISVSERLKKQFLFLEENPRYAWVGCTAELFDADGVWGLAERPEFPDKVDFLRYSPFIHPGVMFRKEVLVKEKGYCEEAVTARCEDFELFMRLYAEGYRAYNIQEELLQYRSDRRRLSRSLRYSLNEAQVRIRGFKRLGFDLQRIWPFILRPVLVWAVSKAPKFSQKIRLNRSKGDHVVRG